MTARLRRLKERLALISPRKKLVAAAVFFVLYAGVQWTNHDFYGTMDFACARQEQSELLPPGTTAAYGETAGGSSHRWVLRRTGEQWTLRYLDKRGFLWVPGYRHYIQSAGAEDTLTGWFPQEPIWHDASSMPDPVTVLAVAPDARIVRVEATLWAQPNEHLDSRYTPTTPTVVDLTPAGTDGRVFLGTLTYHRDDELAALIDRFWLPDGYSDYPLHDYDVCCTLRGYDAAGALVAAYDFPPHS